MKRAITLIGVCVLSMLLLGTTMVWLGYHSAQAQVPAPPPQRAEREPAVEPSGSETRDVAEMPWELYATGRQEAITFTLQSAIEAWELQSAQQLPSGCAVRPQYTFPPCTPITEDIDSNTTWGDPCYKVDKNVVTVQPSATLTIEPGVWVLFTNTAKLYILGRLDAVGTSDQPITFTAKSSSDLTHCIWVGISFGENSIRNRNRIENALIEYACTGIAPSGSTKEGDGDTILSNTLRCNGGSETFNSAIGGDIDYSRIENNEIYSCTSGIVLNEASYNQFTDNIIKGIDRYGLYFRGKATGGGNHNEIDGNLIHDCGRDGIRMEDGRDNQVLSNTIYNTAYSSTNSSAAIHLLDQDEATVQYNQIYSNGIGGGGYQAALYITGTNSEIGSIAHNVIYDTITDTVEFDDGASMDRGAFLELNALCSLPSYELQNGGPYLVEAPSNWWGTPHPNAPTFGYDPPNDNLYGDENIEAEIEPWIRLTPQDPITIPGNVGVTATLWITMNDGQVPPNTVPEPVRDGPPDVNPRLLNLTPLPSGVGEFNPSPVTLNDEGYASTIFTLNDPSLVPDNDRITVEVRAFCDFITTTFINVQRTDLAITKTIPVTQVKHDEPLTYTIAYTNYYCLTAQDVCITDTLPPGTTWAGDTNDWPTRTVSPGQVTWCTPTWAAAPMAASS